MTLSLSRTQGYERPLKSLDLLTVRVRQIWQLACRQDAVGDGSLRPRCRHLRTKRNMPVVFNTGLFGPLCDNTTSSTKPEVHNVQHCRQRMTEPRRPQVT